MKRRALSRKDIIFIILSFALLFVIIIYLNLLTSLSFAGNWKEVKIPEGVTYMQGVNILKNEGIVKNEFLLLVLGKITMTERKLRAGYYNLNSTMSLWDVFNNLRKGMIIQYAITIPEGSTLEDIKLKLENKRLMDDESWKLVKDKNFLESLGINSPSLEGYLYPDTYNFAKGTDPENIFKMMVEKLRENFSAPLMQKAEKTDMTENEVLTLASIIEREAGVDEERPLISAVYHNRLRKKMPLQADPTAIYGMKKSGREITKSDLKRRTPYNTYVINGLPPGPIASPGIKSIKAAIDPADVNYIYFVSKNDGTHHFSSTPEEHLEAVILYQKNKEDNAKNPKEKTN